MNIAVIGLGHAGLPLAAVITDSGYNVTGIDTDKKLCDKINNKINPYPDEPELKELLKKHGGKNLIATTDYKDAKKCVFYIILVPVTINDLNEIDFSNLIKALSNIGRYCLKKEDCVVLETTVPPGTTETLVKKLLEKHSGLKFGDFYIAYSPERIMTGVSIQRLKNFPKIISGLDINSTNISYNVYKNFIPYLSTVSTPQVAEFTKIIEGCYRFVNIALANELYKIASDLDIDFFESQKAANNIFCHILNPSTGVGGHCIPVYPWFLINKIIKTTDINPFLLKESDKVNKSMIDFFCLKIYHFCNNIHIENHKKIRVCVTGISFREGIKSIYRSTNVDLIKHLKSYGINVFVYDELFTRKEIEDMGFSYLDPEEADVVFNPFNLTLCLKNKKFVDKQKG